MVNPQFDEQQPLSLAEVKDILKKIEKRDEELNYRSNKCKEFLDNFTSLDLKKNAELAEKLEGLNLTRLKTEHIMKICDFLPTTVNDLKVVLLAYPLSMPKKDMESIVAVVKDFA